jgi:hypothetical protein
LLQNWRLIIILRFTQSESDKWVCSDTYGIDPFFGDLIYTEQKVEIDELALQNIASVTGGKYFSNF